MTKIIRILFLLSMPLGVFGQADTLWNQFPTHFDHPFRSVKSPSMLIFEGDYKVDASSANNQFLWKISTQRFLDSDLIRYNADRSKAKNLFGVDNGFALTYYHLNKGFLKRDSLHWFVRYGFQDQGGVNYSDDFFRLVGLGNAEFQGDSAVADGLTFKRMRYDYVDFGVIRFFENKSNLSVSLGVTRGIRLIDLEAARLTVGTAEYGTSTDWRVNMYLRLTPAREQTLADIHGMGAKVNIEYKGLVGADGAYAVGIRNLGFINWSGTQYTKAASFTYNGWYVPDWEDLQEGQQAYDSIAQQFVPDSAGFRRNELLPAYVYAEYTMRIRQKQALSFRFDQVFNQVMVPRFTLEHVYFWKRFYTSTRLSFGGYGRMNLSQDLGFRFGKQFVLVHLYGVDALLTPKLSSGLGGGLKYAFSF